MSIVWSPRRNQNRCSCIALLPVHRGHAPNRQYISAGMCQWTGQREGYNKTHEMNAYLGDRINASRRSLLPFA
jgi:hypothetical protein